MASAQDERELVLGLLHDVRFLERAAASDVRGRAFDKKFFGWIWDVSIKYFNHPRYGKHSVTTEILKRLLEQDKSVDDQMMVRYARLLDRLGSMKPVNPEFAFSNIDKFARTNALVLELERVSTALEGNTDVDDVIDSMGTFLNQKRLQKEADYQIVDYPSDFEKRQQERKDRHDHPETYKTFRFGIAQLDQRIPRGMMPGMMFSWLGKTGIGKSILCNNCTVQAAFQKFNVTQIITENEIEQIAGRMDARVTGVPYDILQLYNFEGENLRYLRQAHMMFNLFRDAVKPRIKIVKLIPNQFNILTIENVLDRLAKEGHETEVLIVDSPDYMQAVTKFQEYRLQKAASYWELNAFTLERHLITGVSTHLKASTSDRPTAEDTAEAYDKARLLSYMFAAVRNAKQRLIGEMEVHVLKARDSDNDPTPIKLKPDFSRMIVDVS
jgi:archaellum biogenesis ATPase FlaH